MGNGLLLVNKKGESVLQQYLTESDVEAFP